MAARCSTGPLAAKRQRSELQKASGSPLPTKCRDALARTKRDFLRPTERCVAPLKDSERVVAFMRSPTGLTLPLGFAARARVLRKAVRLTFQACSCCSARVYGAFGDDRVSHSSRQQRQCSLSQSEQHLHSSLPPHALHSAQQSCGQSVAPQRESAQPMASFSTHDGDSQRRQLSTDQSPHSQARFVRKKPQRLSERNSLRQCGSPILRQSYCGSVRLLRESVHGSASSQICEMPQQWSTGLHSFPCGRRPVSLARRFSAASGDKLKKVGVPPGAGHAPPAHGTPPCSLCSHASADSRSLLADDVQHDITKKAKKCTRLSLITVNINI